MTYWNLNPILFVKRPMSPEYSRPHESMNKNGGYNERKRQKVINKA